MRWRIRERFILLFTLSAMLPVVLMAMVTYCDARNSLKEAIASEAFELTRRTSQQLEQFMGQRPQEVATSTAQGQVIGKRHFGRKALPPGGGGGKSGARELFDTLLLWKARVALDAEGRATIEVPMNDSLSSFRLVAIAHAGEAKFGSGAASVRSARNSAAK